VQNPPNQKGSELSMALSV
jgi:hypothetical protein